MPPRPAPGYAGLAVALLLLSTLALAAPRTTGLLVCSGTCEADSAWLTSVGDGGPGGFSVVDFDAGLGPGAVADGAEAREAFYVALETVRAAGPEKKWGEVLDASQAGIDAAARWRGTITQRDLFDLYVWRGVAQVERGRDDGQAYSFRMAAAIADKADLALPEMGPEAHRAWLDEVRKLTVAGRGQLALDGAPEGTRWYVDGALRPAGTVELPPGNHRITAVAPGRIRTWKADVPVLPARTSTVRPSFEVIDDATWTWARLEGALLALEAPDNVKDLLVSWCADMKVDELRLMRVEEVRRTILPSPVAMSDAPADRPNAAAGPPKNMGDGIPTTYEGEIVQRWAAGAEGHVDEAHRLRVVFFDPATRRFSTDTRVATSLQPGPERLRVGLRAGWTAMIDRGHLAGDLALVVPAGKVSVDARLGVVRADEPYNLYTTWVDRQLYHLYVGARWAPETRLAPFVSGGAELYAPVSIGVRAAGGLQAAFAERWRAELEGAAGYGTQGPTLAVGLGVSRGF